MSIETIAPTANPIARNRGPRVTPLVIGGLVALVALSMLVGGVWGVWVDRIDRHDGFVTMGTRDLNTETYALISELHGDGPRWIYGPTVLGNTRVRATSQHGTPLFIGIARTDAVSRYLEGAGYATIQHLVTGDVTTHAGRAPSAPPTAVSIWAASTQGTGLQTLRWKPHSGDWSIVLMNTDARAGVAISGDLGAKMPLLPWVALGLFVVGAGLAVLAAWLFVRAFRRDSQPLLPRTDARTAATTVNVPIDVSR
jgi:hypothetical protein